MDSNQFLSYFWGLSNENTDEQILKSAESIVNLVEYEQKIGTKERESPVSNIKYKLYLNICENPSEDLLYTMKRLIGGISSTGIESRRGFLLTFNLMIEKFSNLLNFHELINVIEKETTVSKSEKNHIKNCAITGKVLMLKSVLEITSLTADVILHVFRNFCEMLTQPVYQVVEEPILQVINEFFSKSAELNLYSEFENGKKYGRFLEKLFNLIMKILNSKSRFVNLKKLSEISLFFILYKYQLSSKYDASSKDLNKLSEILSQSIKSHFNLNEEFLSHLGNYLKTILSKNVKGYGFHISFDLLLELLKRITDNKKIYGIWNLLIDEELQKELKVISLKNYQLLVYNFSNFILQNFFVLNYVKEIFDASFFENLLKFSSAKKFKYINGLIETLTTKLSKAKENGEAESVSEYSFNLLQIFGSDPLKNLSPQSYKNFFIFLFNNLEAGKKLAFVEKQSSLNINNEQSENEDTLEYEEFLFRLTALKQLMISREANLDDSLKLKILEFFFKEHLDNELQKADIELENIIEDRLLLVIFAYFKIDSNLSTDNSSKTNLSLPDKKVVKSLIKVNKLMQKMIKSNTVENVDMEDFKPYAKFYKKFVALVPELSEKKKTKLDKESNLDNEKLYSILKLAFVALILFVKNPEDYSDILGDLYEITKFDLNWTSVYTDLIISLLHKGNNTLADWAMNNFRKMSKYMNKQSFNTITEFLALKDEANSKDQNKKGVKMFDDLNDEEKSKNSDAEMQEI